MKYLVCQDWINTSNNHAGMKHMCNLLKNKYPTHYEVIVLNDFLSEIDNSTLLGKFHYQLTRNIIVPYIYLKIARNIYSKINSNDEVYLLEYCTPSYPQMIIAKYFKKNKCQFSVNGIVHLVPQDLKNNYSKKQIKKNLNLLDNVITLGSSLSEFFIEEIKISPQKIKTLFHYTDLDYYKPDNKNDVSGKLNIIVIGSMKRNYKILKDVVLSCSNANFIICQGKNDLRHLFDNIPNVKLIGFINEDELLMLMKHSDISLNIMDDTIGSNVITTSMAVGLAMIVSDVGSIRDYCFSDGAIYCNNEKPESFSKAINLLYSDKYILHTLKSKSIKYSKFLSIERINNFL